MNKLGPSIVMVLCLADDSASGSVCELSIDMFSLSLLHGSTRAAKVDLAAGRSTESKKLALRLADQSTLIGLLRAFLKFTGD